MGRPLKSSLFSSEEGSLAVKFHNGTEVVLGYIVRQAGSIKFEVSDGTTTKHCYLAQTTEEAEALTGNICTIEVETLNGNLYIKKMTSNQLTATDGNNYIWQRDPEVPGNGMVVMIGGDTIFGPIPEFVPLAARAYAHFGLGQYYAADGSVSTVDGIYGGDPRYTSSLPVPVVVDNLLQSSGNTNGVILSQIVDDIIENNASTTVFEFEVDAFVAGATAQSFMYLGAPPEGGIALFTLTVEVIAENTLRVFAEQTGYGASHTDDGHITINTFRFSGTTVRVAVTFGETMALSVNGSIPQSVSCPNANLISASFVTFFFRGTTFKLDDMVVYDPKFGEDLQRLSAVESAPNVPTWIPDGVVAMADFNANVYYDGQALVPMSDIVENMNPDILFIVPNDGLRATDPNYVETVNILKFKGQLKDAILGGPPVTVVLENFSSWPSIVLRSTSADGLNNALTVTVTTAFFSPGTATVQFTNGSGSITTALPARSSQPFPGFSRLAFTLNGGQVLTSYNGTTGSSGTYAAPEPLGSDENLELEVNGLYDNMIMRSITVYSGAKTQTELNAISKLPNYASR